MKEIIIKENEAGQRLDKYLHKYLKEASGSFIYKMLRKKNITLNGKKASGSEKLCMGDGIKLFLADETLEKFRGKSGSLPDEGSEYAAAYKKYGSLEIIFENHHVLFINKPAGMLTQKAAPDDLSLNEWLTGYMLAKGKIDVETLQTFRPSVCNRLDRNTSGIVICGKTLCGSQEMSRLLKERSLHKYYRLYVKGIMKEAASIDGYLVKDEKTNTVRLLQEEECGASYIMTKYKPIKNYQIKNYHDNFYHELTLLEVELITGKTHQIRVHLAGTGHPLVGDYKYGDRKFNDLYKQKYGIKSQMLHAYRLEFPVLSGEMEELSKKIFTAKPPEIFDILDET